MRTKLTIGNVQLGEVKLENISIENEYSAGEVMQLLQIGKSFMKDVIKELPEMLEDVEKVFNKFNEINDRCECYRDTQTDIEGDVEEDEIINHLRAHFASMGLDPDRMHIERVMRPRG